MRKLFCSLVITTAACALGAGAAAGQATPPRAAITRADLAAAYMRLDRAIDAATLDDTTRASVNRAFDRSTLSFFAGRFASAVATIDSLTHRLAPNAPAPASGVNAPRMVNGELPSAIRARLAGRLAMLDTTGPLRQAINAATARAALLVDSPNPERGAEFLSNPVELASAVTREVGLLEQGRNPYANAPGDLWRAFRGANGGLIPFRVVASNAVAASTKPVPVLFVLHGAGGDENMFIDAYGAGITPRLARDNGMLLISVATVPFSASSANFDTLLEILRGEYAIDAKRVYVLGHSMGAGASAKLAQERPLVIAAAVCLAGGAAVTAEGAPPVFFMSGELDPLIPATTVKAAAAKTPTGEFHLARNEGHTLMVANGVRAAIPWLLERHR